MTIGKMASRAGVGIETVRYYERKGLLNQPTRSYTGYRQYRQEAVQRIRFIKRAQKLGFTLREISGLLCLSSDSKTTCEDLRQEAEGEIRNVEEKIRDLVRLHDTLKSLAEACASADGIGECPILDFLEEEDIN